MSKASQGVQEAIDDPNNFAQITIDHKAYMVHHGDESPYVEVHQKSGILYYKGYNYDLFPSSFDFLDDPIAQAYDWVGLARNVAIGLTVVVIVAAGGYVLLAALPGGAAAGIGGLTVAGKTALTAGAIGATGILTMGAGDALSGRVTDLEDYVKQAFVSTAMVIVTGGTGQIANSFAVQGIIAKTAGLYAASIGGQSILTQAIMNDGYIEWDNVIAATALGAVMGGTIGAYNKYTFVHNNIPPDNGLYRKTSNTGPYKNLQEPMQHRNIKQIANKLGIDLSDVKVMIIRDESLIGKGLYGWTDGKVLHLYPDAFIDTETLVSTLGHEFVHIGQNQLFGPPGNNIIGNIYETEAYSSEFTWWYLYNK